jgi:hypothetical protein
MSQITQDIFDREIAMCKNLSQKNGGHCNWGKCDQCGVIPMLYKLHQGRFLEDTNEIKNIKNKLFS